MSSQTRNLVVFTDRRRGSPSSVALTLSTRTEAWNTENGRRCKAMENKNKLKMLRLQGVYAYPGIHATGGFLGGDAPLCLLYELYSADTDASVGLYYDALRDRVIGPGAVQVAWPDEEQHLVSVHEWVGGSTGAKQMSLQAFRKSLRTLWVRRQACCSMLQFCRLHTLASCMPLLAGPACRCFAREHVCKLHAVACWSGMSLHAVACWSGMSLFCT